MHLMQHNVFVSVTVHHIQHLLIPQSIDVNQHALNLTSLMIQLINAFYHVQQVQITMQILIQEHVLQPAHGEVIGDHMQKITIELV